MYTQDDRSIDTSEGDQPGHKAKANKRSLYGPLGFILLGLLLALALLFIAISF